MVKQQVQRAIAPTEDVQSTDVEHREVREPAPQPERDSVEDLARRVAVLEQHIL